MRWYLANNEKEHRDYALDFVDANGYGGTLWLTFSLDDRQVYVGLETHNADGNHMSTGKRMYVPIVWANAIASGVDGYTMASPAPVRRCACGYELRDYADTETQCGACAAKEN